ncbi:MAG: PAS domain-containing protein [Pyrinomonadaceae bacterium]
MSRITINIDGSNPDAPRWPRMALGVLAAIFVLIVTGVLEVIGLQSGWFEPTLGSVFRTLIEIGVFILVFWVAATAVRKYRQESLQSSLSAHDSALELARIADAVPHIVWIADAEGNVIYCNQSIARLGGIAITEDGYSDFSASIHADDRQETTAVWQNSIETAADYVREHRLLSSEGTYRMHLTRAFPAFGSDGHVTKWYGTDTDIHDLTLVNETLRVSDERLRRALDAGQLGTWELDSVNKRVEWDPRSKELFGISQDAEVIYGQTIWLAIPEDEHAAVKTATAKALDPLGDGVFDVEHRVQLADGSIRWLHDLGRAEFVREKSTRKAVIMRGTVADITDQKEEETRFALLARLGDLIRTEDDPPDLLYAVARAVGDSFNAARCLFSSIDLDTGLETINRDYCRGVHSITGEVPISTHGPLVVEQLRSGKTVVVSDIGRDPRTREHYRSIPDPNRERSHIAVPLLRGGTLVASFWIADTRSRIWSSAEVRVIESIAERTWLAVEKLMSDAAMREAEAKLLTANERFVLAQKAGCVGVWDWDMAADRTYWSETMWEIYGEKPSDLNPDQAYWESHIHIDDRVSIKEKFFAMIESGKDRFSDEFRIVLDDDQIRWIQTAAKIVREPSGKPLRAYGVNLDITERKQAEEQLRSAKDRLEDRVSERTQELAESNLALLEEMDERKVAERQRIELLQRLISSQEVERRRIARDIHDQLGQRLTALRLKIASLKDTTVSSEEIALRVQRLQEIAETLDSEVSFLAWELRPTALDDLGLVDAVGAFVHEWSKHAEIEADFHSSDFPAERLDREVETHLYRITQEALNNVAKHAAAAHVTVLLERREETIVLIIEDDGGGFSHDGDHKKPHGSGGLGLIGMSERAGLIDGELEIESAPGKGTTIYVRIPFSENLT